MVLLVFTQNSLDVNAAHIPDEMLLCSMFTLVSAHWADDGSVQITLILLLEPEPAAGIN